MKKLSLIITISLLALLLSSCEAPPLDDNQAQSDLDKITDNISSISKIGDLDLRLSKYDQLSRSLGIETEQTKQYGKWRHTIDKSPLDDSTEWNLFLKSDTELSSKDEARAKMLDAFEDSIYFKKGDLEDKADTLPHYYNAEGSISMKIARGKMKHFQLNINIPLKDKIRFNASGIKLPAFIRLDNETPIETQIFLKYGEVKLDAFAEQMFFKALSEAKVIKLFIKEPGADRERYAQVYFTSTGYSEIISLSMVARSADYVNYNVTDNQREIIQIVMPKGGVVTQELHKEFWRTIPVQDQDQIGHFFERYIESNFTNGIEFMEEAWRSANISLHCGKPVATLRFLELKEKVIKDAEENCGFPKGTRDYYSFISSFRKQFNKSYDNAITIIRCAAARKPMQTEFKGEIEITEETIENALAASEGVKERLLKLTNPRWQ